MPNRTKLWFDPFSRQIKRQLSWLLLAEHQHPCRSAKRTARIGASTEQIKQLQIEKGQVEKQVSRLDMLIAQQMVRLDTRNKSVLDSLKIIARNAFYRALAPFKEAYNNYRDDHELFRNFTQCDGVLVEYADRVEALFLPTPNHPPKVRKILTALLETLNGSGLILPDGSSRPLRLFLAEKEGIELAIDPTHKS